MLDQYDDEDPSTDAEVEAELRGEFQMSWVCGGGRPEDGPAAYACTTNWAPSHAAIGAPVISPKRIQLRRTKGWRKPEGAIVVARPTRWGNPYRIATGCQSTVPFSEAIVVEMFRRDLVRTIERPWTVAHDIEFRVIAESLDELRGHDLACWCPLDQPCHADVLLELANPSRQRPRDD